MQINGLIKTTLLDYPSYLASTIFLGGCNFRCPFCHNKNLVINPELEETISYDYIFDYLDKRKDILDGVVISGGEPTIHNDLKPFISRIKSMGFKVKLDTNGYRPDVIKDLYNNNLLNYVAMDIKASKDKYPLVSGVENLDFKKIQESVDFIMSNMEDYEFRTTVVKEFHSHDDIKEIKGWLSGCKLYRLQSYRDNDNVICPGFSSYTEDELNSLGEK